MGFNVPSCAGVTEMPHHPSLALWSWRLFMTICGREPQTCVWGHHGLGDCLRGYLPRAFKVGATISFCLAARNLVRILKKHSNVNCPCFTFIEWQTCIVMSSPLTCADPGQRRVLTLGNSVVSIFSPFPAFELSSQIKLVSFFCCCTLLHV